MPTYEYECVDCGHSVEVFHAISGKGPSECESCHNTQMRKRIFPVNSIYKGNGFYSTDYRSSSYKEEQSKETQPAPQPAAATSGGCGSGACGHKH